MKVTIAAVGRLKAGPERELFARYLDRAGKAGRTLGLSFALREVMEDRAAEAHVRKDREALALVAGLPASATLVALDERGRSLDSRAFAGKLSAWRDSGVEDVAFAIGGADGLGPALLGKAALTLSFGAMTWPHQLVRMMLAEQLYRAVTILTGHPYHRD